MYGRYQNDHEGVYVTHCFLFIYQSLSSHQHQKRESVTPLPDIKDHQVVDLTAMIVQRTF